MNDREERLQETARLLPRPQHTAVHESEVGSLKRKVAALQAEVAIWRGAYPHQFASIRHGALVERPNGLSEYL